MNVKTISNRIYDERQLKALTGLSVKEFFILLPVFHELIINKKEDNKKDKIKPNNGNDGKLITSNDKLFFVLYYLKCYPTFDQFGFNFNMNRSGAHTWLYKILPILFETLNILNVIPETKFETPEEMINALKGVDTLLIDVTERIIQRPQDKKKQTEHYSGKKKQHTIKNTIIVSLTLYVLYIGITLYGKKHDYSMFKEEFNSELNWFYNFFIYVDLGYIGFDKDYETKNIFIPHKKPRKSKKNPNPELTQLQKNENKKMSKERIIVEHAIGGMKRFRCLVDKFRNHIPYVKDLFILLSAGIWNLHINTRI